MESKLSHISLDLSAAPPIIYLFGLTGSGKNYVGDLLAQHSGRRVYHADDDLTPEMRKALALRTGFTEEMRDEFFRIVAARINELKSMSGPMIVTQATYKRKHRDYLQKHVSGLEFVLIHARDELIVRRLTLRGGSITPDFAAEMRKNFEPPDPPCKVLVNNAGEAEIIEQARSL